MITCTDQYIHRFQNKCINCTLIPYTLYLGQNCHYPAVFFYQCVFYIYIYIYIHTHCKNVTLSKISR